MEKRVIRTEAAPAPFQGAPYNQAIVVGELVFVAGQLGLAAGRHGGRGRHRAADGAGARATSPPSSRPPGSSMDKLVKTSVFLLDLEDFQAMNEVYATRVGSQPPARSTFQVAEASVRRARRDRGRRPPVGARQRRSACPCRPRSAATSARSASTRTSSGAPSATSCSASTTRTRTSSCRASTMPACARRSSRTGAIEDMEVHGQLVGVRFYPRDPAIRALAPAGIELTPPRRERSVGPGHRDFEIVADPTVSIEDDMARRDFTVNAMAKRLETGELVDPFGGRAHLERRELRTVGAESFREDPLRILRGLRLVSQLGFTLTRRHARADAGRGSAASRHVSGERIGGGLAADGMGELSKLLLGHTAGRGAPDRARHRRARRGPAGVRGRDRLRPRLGPAARAARRAPLRRRPGGGRRSARR